jgi:hypothetical protein
MKPLLTVLLLIGILSTGCVPKMIMNSMDHDKYSEYVQNTNHLNLEREKAGLKPIPVMTFNEWRGEKK